MNEIQKKIFSIFQEVKKVCENNGIRYFAIGGTCIGAVRHRGFIPWDDDIDIAIPIEQYGTFLQCAEVQLPCNLKVYTCDQRKHYKNLFAKVHDVNTTFVETGECKHVDAYKGVYVDIMPISGIPQDSKERKRFSKKIIHYCKINYIHRYPFREMYSLKTKFVWVLHHITMFWRPFNYYTYKWIKHLQTRPLQQSFLTGYVWSQSVEKIVVVSADFADIVILPFENDSIACPVGYDHYLSTQFGNYMELPPLEKQTCHQAEIIDLNNSYIKYIDNGGK